MRIEKGDACRGGASRPAEDVPSGVLTLADIAEGERVEIQAFLSESVRRASGEVGVRAGGVIVCRERSPEGVVVELPDGHSVTYDRVCAGLVQVESLGVREEPRTEVATPVAPPGDGGEDRRGGGAV